MPYSEVTSSATTTISTIGTIPTIPTIITKKDQEIEEKMICLENTVKGLEERIKMMSEDTISHIDMATETNNTNMEKIYYN
jgi:hypothetical protein